MLLYKTLQEICYCIRHYKKYVIVLYATRNMLLYYTPHEICYCIIRHKSYDVVLDATINMLLYWTPQTKLFLYKVLSFKLYYLQCCIIHAMLYRIGHSSTDCITGTCIRIQPFKRTCQNKHLKHDQPCI